jgi:hypothetical protein
MGSSYDCRVVTFTLHGLTDVLWPEDTGLIQNFQIKIFLNEPFDGDTLLLEIYQNPSAHLDGIMDNY